MSASTGLSVEEILKANAKWNTEGIGSGKLLKLEEGKMTISKGKFPTGYVPLTFRNESDVYVPLKLRFTKQIILSAKTQVPKEESKKKSDDDKLTPRVGFSKITAEILSKSSYKSEVHASFIKYNEDFIKANDIIIQEFLALDVIGVNIKDDKASKARRKLYTNSGIAIDKLAYNYPRQDVAQLTKEEIAENEKKGIEPDCYTKKGLPAKNIENRIYRYNLPFEQNTTYIRKVYNSDKIKYKSGKNYVQVVYDVKNQEVEPTINRRPLTILNVHEFITYLSIASGVVDMSTVVISGQGASLRAEIQKIYIAKHNRKDTADLSKEEIADLNDMAKYMEQPEDSGFDENQLTSSTTSAPPRGEFQEQLSSNEADANDDLSGDDAKGSSEDIKPKEKSTKDKDKEKSKKSKDKDRKKSKKDKSVPTQRKPKSKKKIESEEDNGSDVEKSEERSEEGKSGAEDDEDDE
jgi:hypothetical protein